MPEKPLPEIGYQITGYWETAKAIQAVECALNSGFQYIVTDSSNEEEVGTGLERADVSRDEVVLATRIHWENLNYDDVFDSAERSLNSLNVDYVDQILVRRPKNDFDPEEVFTAFNELYETNQIGAVGVSNFSIPEMEQAMKLAEVPLVGNQVEMHPLNQQEKIHEFLISNSFYLIANSPLFGDYIHWVDELRWVADENDITPAQAAISWLTSKRGVVSIPMGETPRQIREYHDAASFQLPEKHISVLDDIPVEERRPPSGFVYYGDDIEGRDFDGIYKGIDKIAEDRDGVFLVVCLVDDDLHGILDIGVSHQTEHGLAGAIRDHARRARWIEMSHGELGYLVNEASDGEAREMLQELEQELDPICTPSGE